MPDDLKRKKPEDMTKINVGQSWERDFWCKELGVSEFKLRVAVEAVGPMVKDVKRHLGLS